MRRTFTVSSEGSERVVVLDRSRTSSGRSVSVQSPTESSGSRSYAGSTGSDSWSEVEHPYEGEEEDEIDPSDSASRSRQPPSRRSTTETRPAPKRRHSSRRITEREEIPSRRHSSRRHHSSRHRRHESQRVPSDDSASTVASHDDYPYSHHGAPMPPQPQHPYRQPPSGYRHVPAQNHGGYAPSQMTQPGYPDAFTAQQQALVQMAPQTDAFGYPSANPFSSGSQQQNNPFSPMGNSSQSSYFATDPHAPQMPPQHHRPPGPPRPQSFIAPGSHYGSEMTAYQPPGMQPYPGYGIAGMPPAGMHPGMMPYGMPGWYPPSQHSTPATAAEGKKDKSDDVDKLEKLLAKHEEARMAWEKEWIAKREAEAAAKAAEEMKVEEEKKRKQELADATAKAKKDAEEKAKAAADKAKEDHEKKLKEAQKAKEDAEKKQKELEEAAEKSKPAPDTLKEPIKFKDAVGRKFSFPFHLCKTWKGMEGLIKQAFLHVDVIGEHVHQGHYDLTGPDGEIILPQVWDTMIRPDWEITMHMWPMPEEGKKDDIDGIGDPFAALGLGDLGLVDSKKGKKSSGKKDKKKSGRSDGAIVVDVGPDHLPPSSFPTGIIPNDPLFGSVMPDEKGGKKSGGSKGARAGSKSSKEVGGLAAWLAGGSGGRPSKKDDEKLGLARQRSTASASSSSQHRREEQSVACAVM